MLALSHQSSYRPFHRSASEKWHNFFPPAPVRPSQSHFCPTKKWPKFIDGRVKERWERERWALLTRLFRGALLLLAHQSPCKWHYFCRENWGNVSYLFFVLSNTKRSSIAHVPISVLFYLKSLFVRIRKTQTRTPENFLFFARLLLTANFPLFFTFSLFLEEDRRKSFEEGKKGRELWNDKTFLLACKKTWGLLSSAIFTWVPPQLLSYIFFFLFSAKKVRSDKRRYIYGN